MSSSRRVSPIRKLLNPSREAYHRGMHTPAVARELLPLIARSRDETEANRRIAAPVILPREWPRFRSGGIDLTCANLCE